MRKTVLGIVALFALPLCAQTADEIIAKYIKTIGGMERIDAVKSLRQSGKFTGGGGFEAKVVQEKKRPDMIRQEFLLQGMTGVTAYDGKSGWKIEPWMGKKDPEPLGEDEMKTIVEESDFDGPLVNYQQKGNKVEYMGTEPVEGTDAYKLRVTLKNGDVFTYYMDTDYYVPIKIAMKKFVRGEEREFETSLGDYKAINGWYLPYSMETGPKGSSFRAKITVDKAEANVAIDDSRFRAPAIQPSKLQAAPDASNVQPKKPEEQKPPVAESRSTHATVILSAAKDLNTPQSPLRSFAVCAAQADGPAKEQR
jgi:outer membrane lipoprotein-sorting protein